MTKKLLTGLVALGCASTAFGQACIPSGETDIQIPFVAVDATDRVSFETGLSSWTVIRSRNGAADTTYTTPTIAETDASTMPGQYWLLVDEDTTIGAGNDKENYVVRITHAGMAPVTLSTCIERPKVTLGQTLTVGADGVGEGNLVEVLDTDVSAATAGVLNVNASRIGNTTQTGRDLGTSVLLSSGTGTGQVLLTAGAVTVGTNNDKTGYALSTAAVEAILLGQGIPAPTTIGTYTSQVSFTLNAGSTNDNAYNGYAAVVRDAATPSQTALGCVSDYTGSTRTVSLLADPGIFTFASTDNVVLLPAYCDSAVGSAMLETALLRCDVDTANFAGDADEVACDLTDPLTGVAVTSNLADGDLSGLEFIVLTGAQKYESRFITPATDWDGPNNEMRFTLQRSFAAGLADGVIAIIR